MHRIENRLKSLPKLRTESSPAPSLHFRMALTVGDRASDERRLTGAPLSHFTGGLRTGFSRMLSRYRAEGPRRDVSAGEELPR